MVLCLLGVYGISLNKASNGQETSSWGLLVCLTFAVNNSGLTVIIRKLKNIHYAVLGFYHPILGMCMYVTYTLIVEPLKLHSMHVYLLILAACSCDFIAFTSRNIAQQCDSSSFLAVLGYIVILYGFFADWFIFDYTPSGYDLLGALLILLVTLSVALYKLQKN